MPARRIIKQNSIDRPAGIAITRSQQDLPSERREILTGVISLLLGYAAIWGMLWSALSLPAESVWILLPGAGTLIMVFLLMRRPRQMSLNKIILILLAALVLVSVIRFATLEAGWKVLANRLFERSAQEQAYVYDMYKLSGSEVQQGGWLLWTSGVLGLWSGGISAVLWLTLPALVPVLLLGAAALILAFFGISVPLWVLILLPVSILAYAISAGQSVRFRSVLLIGMLFLLVAAAVLVLHPGEDAALVNREETLRDSMAYQTAAYPEEETVVEIPEKPKTEIEESEFQQEESTQNEDLPERDWKTPLKKALVIALVALILFLPSIFNDILRRRQQKNRAGIEDEDPSKAIHAIFLYTIRWLRQMGLPTDNRPYREYTNEVQKIASRGGERYEAMVDLWQESFYSEHAMTEEQREQMKQFSTSVQEEILEKMDRKQRLRVKYVEAL